MVSTDSAMGRLLESATENITDLLADQMSGEVHPNATKLFSLLALLGVYQVTRKIAIHSKSFSKYCLQATPRQGTNSLTARYGGSPQAWVMVLNTVDQLGNAYCHQLAALGFDIVFSGPPIDRDRMERQASLVEQRHQVRTQVLVIDYNEFEKDDQTSYDDLGAALRELDICILVNNQTYTVPYDISRAELLHDQIQSCLAQINKHIKCSLLIQRQIVPKMLLRRKTQNDIRSAILTVKTHANATFEERFGQNFHCPILRSTMAFNAALTQAMHNHYSSDIDIMQAMTPLIAFESYLSQGLILEVVMQERLLSSHVRSVLGHLQRGYAHSYGSMSEALHSNFQILRMRYSIPNSAAVVNFQGQLFDRYAQMAVERNQSTTQRITQLKDSDDGRISNQGSTASEFANSPDQNQLIFDCAGSTSMREFGCQVTPRLRNPESTGLAVELEEEKWLDLSMVEEMTETMEFNMEPIEGDNLEQHNVKVLRTAKMSINKKKFAEDIKQSTQMLLMQRMSGYQATRKAKEEGNLTDMSKILSKLSPQPPPTQKKVQAAKPQPQVAPIVINETKKEEEVKRIPVHQKTWYRAPSRDRSNSTGSGRSSRSNPRTRGRMFQSNLTNVAKLVEASKSMAANPNMINQKHKPEKAAEVRKAFKPTQPAVAKFENEPQPIAQKVTASVSSDKTNPQTPTPTTILSLEAQHVEVKKSEPTPKIETKEEMPKAEVKPAEEASQPETQPAGELQASKTPDSEQLRTDCANNKSSSMPESPATAELKNEVPNTKEAICEFSAATFRPDNGDIGDDSNVMITDDSFQEEESKSTRIMIEETKGPVRESNPFSITSSNDQQKRKVSDSNGQVEVLKDDKSLQEIGGQAPSAETNDTFEMNKREADHFQQQNAAIKFGPQSKAMSPSLPKPYNNLSRDRERSCSNEQSASDANNESIVADEQINTIETYTSDATSEENVSIDDKKMKELDNSVMQAAVPTLEDSKLTSQNSQKTPGKDRTMKSAKNKQMELLITDISPIEVSQAQEEKPETPGFQVDAIEIFKALDQAEKEMEEADEAEEESSEVAEEEVKQDPSPQLAQKQPQMVTVAPINLNAGMASLNRNRNKSRSNNGDLSPKEWIKGPFKTVEVLAAKSKSPVKPTQSADAEPISDSDDSPAVLIRDKSLSSVSEDEISPPAERFNRHKKQRVPKSQRFSLGKDQFSDQGNQIERPSVLSQEDFEHDRISNLTPDNATSNSDMRELKMALGGLSDRSGNNIMFNPAKDTANIIFSDEGSKDTFDLDDEFSSEIWERAQNNPKASIQFLRSMTMKMDQGDELDQAITRVLANLVNHVLIGYDPKSSANEHATKAKQLEHRNQTLIYELATCLPFVKIGPGRYFMGTEIRAIQIKGRGVLVRTGGGFMYLSEFLLHYAKSECLRIGLNMLKQNKSYQQVTITALKRHPDTARAQKDFIKRCPPGIDEQFTNLVQEVRVVEQKLAAKRQNTSIKQRKQLNSSLNASNTYSSQSPMKARSSLVKSLPVTPPKLMLSMNLDQFRSGQQSSNRTNGMSSGRNSSRENRMSHRLRGKNNTDTQAKQLAKTQTMVSPPMKKTGSEMFNNSQLYNSSMRDSDRLATLCTPVRKSDESPSTSPETLSMQRRTRGKKKSLLSKGPPSSEQKQSPPIKSAQNE